MCVAATLPFFARDLRQLETTPPILDAPLDLPALAHHAPTDEAVIEGTIRLKLEEVRTAVGGRYPGWKPQAKTLPETPPTGHRFVAEPPDRYRFPYDEAMYRFAVSCAGGVDETIPVLMRADTGTGRAKDVRAADHESKVDGRQQISTWWSFPSGTRKANVDVAVAFAAETRTLAQFPVPGSLGISYGAKAAWTASGDSHHSLIAVTLPPDLRPDHSGTYCLQTYTIDRWGRETLAGTRRVTLSPVTPEIRIPLMPRLISERDAQAVRVTATPYHWARFADVPLSMPDANVARLNPIPITPEMKQKRTAVLQGSLGAVGDYHELLRVRHDELAHPQLAQFVPGAITLTHTREHLDSNSPGYSRTESHLYAFMPGEWEVATELHLTLFAVTRSGKRVRADSRNITTEGGGVRAVFQLSGVPCEDVAEVSLGLTR